MSTYVSWKGSNQREGGKILCLDEQYAGHVAYFADKWRFVYRPNQIIIFALEFDKDLSFQQVKALITEAFE